MSATLRPLRQRLVAELAAFGLVGGICLASDIALFNAFTFGLGLTPVEAKCVGMVITGLMAYFGHRHVTFRHRQGGGLAREVPLFVLVTLLTVALSVLPLFVADKLLGITSVFWLNLANMAGIGLGTVARYVAYRQVVWIHAPMDFDEIDLASGGAELPGDGVPGDQAGRRSLLQVEHELVRE